MKTMTDISVAEDIIPIGEFKAQAARLLRQLALTSRPLVITQNGRPAGVVLSPVEYDRLCGRERFLASVAAGLDDAEQGRTMDSDALRVRLARRRSERPAP
jgi:prevent-host-death family protein